MRRLALAACAVMLAGILAGCGGEPRSDKASPDLTVSYEVTEDSRLVQIGTDIQGNAEYIMEGYYGVTGIVRNSSRDAAHAAQVVVTARSPSGEILHEETIDVGEVAAGGERPFDYRWDSDEEAEIDVRAVIGVAQNNGD